VPHCQSVSKDRYFPVFAPFLVAGAWWATEHSTIGNRLNGYLGLFLAAFLYVGTVMGLGIGFLCGIIGVIQSKGSKSLAIAGLALTVAVTLWVLHGMK